MGNGENGEWRMENGEWREWRMESGGWRFEFALPCRLCQRLFVRVWSLLSSVIPSDRRESRNLLPESHLPLQVEIPRFPSRLRTGCYAYLE